jgi:hypothetical protein
MMRSTSVGVDLGGFSRVLRGVEDDLTLTENCECCWLKLQDVTERRTVIARKQIVRSMNLIEQLNIKPV